MEDLTSRDLTRQTTTSHDTDYTLTIEEVADRYAKAGHPRTLRTLQRYCASGHLDAQKKETAFGEKYLVTAQSVARHIAQIEELHTSDSTAAGRDQPGHVVPIVVEQSSHRPQAQLPATTVDQPRLAAADDASVSPHVARLEREVERLNDDRLFLREQIKTKDVQIAALLERDRETNILVGSLHKLLSPLLGAPRHEPRNDDQAAPL